MIDAGRIPSPLLLAGAFVADARPTSRGGGVVAAVKNGTQSMIMTIANVFCMLTLLPVLIALIDMTW